MLSFYDANNRFEYLNSLMQIKPFFLQILEALLEGVSRPEGQEGPTIEIVLKD